MKELLEKAYNPVSVEEKWYKYWSEKNYFFAQIDWEKKRYSIVIPPPNVTGSLHLGHALNNILQDIVIRKKRMEGYVSLWLPGTDHAGIATQNVVEQQLAEEGLDRHQVGREEFIKRIWKWKEKYGKTIINQLKRIGCSCDWSRERFTMDEGCSRAVKEVFVRLYNEGLIYKGNYIINWCPRCHTALSDIEVEREETNGSLWFIKYPLKDGGHLTVATTRPETMLGDTAIAVNPNDERFKKHIGKLAILPLLNREIPVIADDYVDPKFGTGSLKITPAHDFNDFEIGKRHNLEKINIFTEEAKVNENGGKYKGLTREEARRAVVKDLKSEGLLEKTETHSLILGRCYRCDTLVEPYLSLQWFMSMKGLAKPAIKAVEEKKVKFTPNNWEKIYFDWMHNIRDWCISRQIWWGHQIPVWYCNSCSEEIASIEVPKECPKCNSLELKQDESVLDTWFSSALWPFSTLGWPKKTDELRYFYPTNLLVTSHDIIFFWIARMIMMGLHFMDEVPFNEVYINALVRDVHGKKMSKSKGNVIDPMQIIDKYGTDALRLTLTALSVQGRDMFLSEERIEGYRNFCNKIWNASRFILMNLEEDMESEAIEPSVETLFDGWIFSRYSKMCSEVRNSLDSYHFSKAVKSLYNFFWDDFCDWYIEISKMFIHKGSQEQKINSLKNLLYILDGFLRLIHPIMPFITEEIWQKLPHKGESIMISPYPKDKQDWINEEKEKQMEMVKNVIIDIRTIRSELSISPVRKIEVLLKVSKKSLASFYSQYQDFIAQLVGAERIGIGVDIIKPSQSAVAVQEDVEIYLPLSGLINLHEEKARIENNIKDVDEELKKVEKKLGNKNFIQKAPENIVEKQKMKLETLEVKKEKLNNLLSFLKE